MNKKIEIKDIDRLIRQLKEEIESYPEITTIKQKKKLAVELYKEYLEQSKNETK